jgi:hypothetical protein
MARTLRFLWLLCPFFVNMYELTVLKEAKKVLAPLHGGEHDVRGFQTFAYGVVEEGNFVLCKTEPEGPCRG